MQYHPSDTGTIGTTQGICPDGWHIPTFAEWETLFNYLGGSGVAAGKLKEKGTAHWESPNQGATNESGFTALPSGLFLIQQGGLREFHWIGRQGHFWSTPEYGNDDSYDIGIHYLNAYVDYGSLSKLKCFSVRCVKDKALVR